MKEFFNTNLKGKVDTILTLRIQFNHKMLKRE